MVKDVLIRMDEFIHQVDFVVLETAKVVNVANHIPIILKRPFFLNYYKCID